MSKEKLMLIDGNSLLHRAFHALPPLATKDGIYTNGVYGFLTMLYKIVDEYDPEYIGVAFDMKGATFRHKEFKDYKAGRKKTPNELAGQFDILKEVLDKLNIYRIELEGFEADDLVGTMAKRGEEEGLEVIAVSGDKDYLQLVSEKTKVLITRKGISNLEIYDTDKLFDRYEVTPTQFIDLKGLMGDKSDNIPGVPGVGEKTGIKLLKQFGSIEGIYEDIEKVKGKKLKEKLIENRQQAFMSKKLATIITHVPIDINKEKLKKEEADNKELYSLYKKLEFNSLLKKIDKNDFMDNISDGKYGEKILVNNMEQIEEVIDDIKKENNMYLKFLIDGDNPLSDKILGLGIKSDSNKTYYINFDENNSDKIIKAMKEIFENKEVRKIGHNLKRDILVLLRYGININGIEFDSMIGQYILNPSESKYELKSIAEGYLQMAIKNKEDLLGKGKRAKKFEDISLDERVNYCTNQLDIIFNSRKPIETKIKDYDMEQLFYEVELPLIEVLANMEFEGFTVDIDKLEESSQDLNNRIEELTETIYDMAGEEFNINSPKQLGNILFERLELPVIKKTKTGYSTSVQVLEKLEKKHPIIEKIMDYRQITKLKSTYIDGLRDLINKDTNKVHSSFNQTITTTGRISSTEPNLQNIPIRTEEGRKIRKFFVASNEDYTLVDADYSQIELRVLAHIADDPKLKEAFFSEDDIHTKTASEVFNVPKEEVTSLMRSRAKAVNFGIVYGISDFGLSRDLDITKKEAKKYIDNYLENYQRVKEYMDNIVDEGKDNGYVKTILNRRRYLPELKSRNYNIRSFGERTAMNTPIQGSAADIIKIAMVKVYNELKKRGMKSKLILQVHDELIIETHKDELKEVKHLLKDLMEKAVDLKVPLKVDMETGDSWYETK